MNIIILIPVFNDFRSTSKLIEEIDSSISNLNASFSVVVINDASTEVKNLENKNLINIKSLKLINMRNNRGHARCIAAGLKYISENEDFDYVKRALIPFFLNDDNQRSRSMTAIVDTMAETIGAEGIAQQLANLRQGRDLRDELSEIICPTLVMCGAADKLIPPELSREVTSGIQRSKLVIVKEAAHLLPLERPETVAEFMRNWLMGNLAMDREEIHL